MSSMFGSLAARFAPSAENLATEAMAYVLARSSAARQALNEMAAILCPNLREARHFRTQSSGDDHEIPDLAGLDQSGREILLIENKFWAGLTANQPAAYLKRLPVDEPALLLFVVPPRRLQAIWPDLVASAAAAGLSLPAPGDLRANSVSAQIGNRTLAVTSWQALLDLIEAHARTSGENATVSDVGQLRGLCEVMNATGYVPMTMEELTNIETPQRMLALSELIKHVCERAVAAGIADVGGLRETHFFHGAGRYVYIGEACAWVGIDHRLWAQYSIGPLWMTFQANKFGRAAEVLNAIAPWLASNPVKAFNRDGVAAIPLRIMPLANRDKVLDDLHEQVVALHGLLRVIPIARERGQVAPAEGSS